SPQLYCGGSRRMSVQSVSLSSATRLPEREMKATNRPSAERLGDSLVLFPGVPSAAMLTHSSVPGRAARVGVGWRGVEVEVGSTAVTVAGVVGLDIVVTVGEGTISVGIVGAVGGALDPVSLLHPVSRINHTSQQPSFVPLTEKGFIINSLSLSMNVG